MRVFAVISLLLSLLSLSSAQLLAPTLVSATNLVTTSSSQVLLVWTISDSCTSMFGCYFGLYVDNLRPSYPLAYQRGVSKYSYTISSPIAVYGAGNHTFSITGNQAFPNFTTPQSNAITVNIQPPTPSTPPAVNPTADIVGDPQFTGLRGQTYQVHGMPNEVFNIISDIDFQYNSRFIYLSTGQCPTMDGRKLDTPCFTHPGTYLGELALQSSAGDKLYLQAGSASEGFQAVVLNDNPLEEGDFIDLTPLTDRPIPYVTRNSSHTVTVQMGNFWLEFTNSDLFVNQRVAMLDATSTTSHGLLGQTWSGKIYDADASIPWIEGNVWDYAMADHELFSHRFVFNQFEVEKEKDEEEESTDGMKKLFKGQIKLGQHTHSHAHGQMADL